MLKRIRDIVYNVYLYNFANLEKTIRYIKDILTTNKFLIERKSKVNVTFSWAIWLTNIDKVNIVFISSNNKDNFNHIFYNNISDLRTNFKY